MNLDKETYLKTIIQIEGEEYTECLTTQDGSTWVHFMEAMLRQHFPAAGFSIDGDDADKILSYIEDTLEERKNSILTPNKTVNTYEYY